MTALSSVCPINARERFHALLRSLRGPYRYSDSKYGALLRECWPIIVRLTRGEEIVARPSYLELHPATPCQLSCLYCREMLRDVPKIESMIDTHILLRIIQDVAAMNLHAFLRFSGTIGEPLLHPQIAEVFKQVNRQRLNFGVTTNGLLLRKKGVLDEIVRARFVHISIDAGSNSSYQQVKKGQDGNYRRVLDNIALVAERRRESSSRVQIVGSMVLQSESYREIPALSRDLKSVGGDVLEVKMQHFDPRLGMLPDEVIEAYRLTEVARQNDEDETFRIVSVQRSPEDALFKLCSPSNSLSFRRCYANLLGLNAAVDPIGQLQTCCQYYGPTLGTQGDLRESSLEEIWQSERRLTVLQDDPRQRCDSCSPSDEAINRFVEFIRAAHEDDPTFLDWADNVVKSPAANEESLL